MVSKGGSLLRFSSAPPSDFSCKTCTSASEAKGLAGVSLKDLGESAEAGCQECILRHAAMMLELGKDPRMDDPRRSVSYNSEGPLTIVRRWFQNGPGGRNITITGGFNVLLYTRHRQPKSSWPIIGVGRDVGNRRTSYAPIVADWLGICRDSHPSCPRNTDVQLPSRVLYVGKADSDRIYLRHVSRERGSYVALSHCWGGGIDIRTTRENYERQRDGILFAELPKTFQDAVDVTRSLGLQYLWVDALCIVQDDLADWEVESGNMAAIYHNAYVVIGADMSVDSHGGFLDAEKPCFNPEGKLIGVVENEGALVYARIHKFHGNPCPLYGGGEPLARRAWTLQEQLLASRMVHFASKEIIWECKTRVFCECMELDDHSSVANEKASYNESLASPSADRFKTWYKIVNGLMGRNITKPGDILPALSGLAKQFQDNGAGVYLAGLWLEDLPMGLLWNIRPYKPISSRVGLYRAPTWSWASLDCRNFEYDSEYRADKARLDKVFAEVLLAQCTPSGRDPLGSVAAGILKLSAPVIESTEIGVDGYSDDAFGQRLHVLYDLSDFKPEPNEKLCYLLVGKLNVKYTPVRGLVLRRSPDVSGNIFERVGYFKLSEDLEPEQIKNLKELIRVVEII